MGLRLLTTFFVLLATQSLLAQTDNPKQNSSLDQIVRQHGNAYLKYSSSVGLSIGIINAGRTSFYNFGATSKDKHQPPTPSTVYEIGSLSKTIAGILLAQAIVDGKVTLDDDIRKYLDGEYQNLQCAGEPIRLVHLANMTSGLPNDLPDLTELRKHTPPADFPALEARLKNVYKKSDFLSDLHQVKLAGKPGGDAAHSNAATQLLSYILERVYQAPFEKLLARFVETPLKLGSGTAETIANLATGYDDKGLPALPISKCDLAAGGLRYSTADMLKYMAYQLDERQKPVELSHQPTWQTLDKELAISFYWIMGHDHFGRRLRYSGGTHGFSSFCDLYPDEKIGIILLANNSSAESQDRLREISERIVEALRRSVSETSK